MIPQLVTWNIMISVGLNKQQVLDANSKAI